MSGKGWCGGYGNPGKIPVPGLPGADPVPKGKSQKANGQAGPSLGQAPLFGCLELRGEWGRSLLFFSFLPDDIVLVFTVPRKEVRRIGRTRKPSIEDSDMSVCQV